MSPPIVIIGREWDACPMAVVIRRCAWCGRYLTPDGWADQIDIADGDIVTHGICDECLQSLRDNGESR